jgi:hypothetical protein
MLALPKLHLYSLLMSEFRTHHNRSYDVKYFLGRTLVGALFVLSPVSAGILGWHQGAAVERQANREAAQEALKLKDCLKITKEKPRQLKLSELSPDDKEACEVPRAPISPSANADSISKLETNSNPTVSLPGPAQLETLINLAEQSAHDYNYNTSKRYALEFILLLGLPIDLGAFMIAADEK